MPKLLHQIAVPIFTTEVYILWQDSLLMFKRSETKKKFPGFWSLPGGHIEAGEDPLASAIREVKEETGVAIPPDDIKLKAIAFHHHLDREEMYISFAFVAELTAEPTVTAESEEGTAHWIKKSDAVTLENVFPPVKYYFDHILNNEPGILYNHSEWENSQLVRILSQSADRNG